MPYDYAFLLHFLFAIFDKIISMSNIYTLVLVHNIETTFYIATNNNGI